MVQPDEAYLGLRMAPSGEQVLDIHQNDLHRIVEIPLECQPLGITSYAFTPDTEEIAYTDYFDPSLRLAKVTRDATGLHLRITQIRGVDYGMLLVRIFPDFFKNDCNRAQTVNFGKGGTLLATRNGDRRFFILHPPGQGGTRFSLIESTCLPEPHDTMVHSALLKQDNTLFTIESLLDIEGWAVNEYRYEQDGRLRQLAGPRPLPPFMYGIGQRPGDKDTLWFVSDSRAKAQPAIYAYRDGMLIPKVYGVYGNGVCFLNDGSAFVTCYCREERKPGKLIYVPARFFE